MSNPITMFAIIGIGMFAIIGTPTVVSNIYSLNNIKSKRVGNGQHGNARFATERKIKKYTHSTLSSESMAKNAGQIYRREPWLE